MGTQDVIDLAAVGVDIEEALNTEYVNAAQACLLTAADRLEQEEGVEEVIAELTLREGAGELPLREAVVRFDYPGALGGRAWVKVEQWPEGCYWEISETGEGFVWRGCAMTGRTAWWAACDALALAVAVGGTE